MRIIILGAGQVGRTVAEIMATAENDVTIVDRQPEVLREMHRRLEIRTVQGHAAHPSVLARAGIEDADLIFAVTNDDEVNMVACQVAYSLYQTPTRLARVRAPDYLGQPRLFSPTAVPVTFLVNPEQLVTARIQRLIDHPGALDMVELAGGKVQLVGLHVEAGSAIEGQALDMLPRLSGNAGAQVAAVYRGDESLRPEPGLCATAGDEVYLFGGSREIRRVIAAFRAGRERNRRVVIAGGGNLGLRLARMLEGNHQVKIVERDPERCRQLAGALRRTVVLRGSATDAELLRSENIEAADVFCATTQQDKINIVASMLAKQLGASKTLAIVNRSAHGLLAEHASLDVALAPAQVTIGALLTYIRRGDIVSVNALRHGHAEALEVIARGDAATSRAVGHSIAELGLAEGVRVGAILRQDQLLFPGPETVIESMDRVMLYIGDRQQVTEVERLFQVAITFM